MKFTVFFLLVFSYFTVSCSGGGKSSRVPKEPENPLEAVYVDGATGGNALSVLSGIQDRSYILWGSKEHYKITSLKKGNFDPSFGIKGSVNVLKELNLPTGTQVISASIFSIVDESAFYQIIHSKKNETNDRLDFIKIDDRGAIKSITSHQLPSRKSAHSHTITQTASGKYYFSYIENTSQGPQQTWLSFNADASLNPNYGASGSLSLTLPDEPAIKSFVKDNGDVLILSQSNISSSIHCKLYDSNENLIFQDHFSNQQILGSSQTHYRDNKIYLASLQYDSASFFVLKDDCTRDSPAWAAPLKLPIDSFPHSNRSGLQMKDTNAFWYYYHLAENKLYKYTFNYIDKVASLEFLSPPPLPVSFESAAINFLNFASRTNTAEMTGFSVQSTVQNTFYSVSIVYNFSDSSFSLKTSFGEDGVSYLSKNNTLNMTPYIEELRITDAGIFGFAQIQKGGSAFDVAIAKFKEDGSLDKSYAQNGILQIPNFTLERIYKTSKNRLHLLGTRSTMKAVLRLDTSGHIEESFGQNGIQTLDLPPYSHLKGLVETNAHILIGYGNITGQYLTWLDSKTGVRSPTDHRFDENFIDIFYVDENTLGLTRISSANLGFLTEHFNLSLKTFTPVQAEAFTGAYSNSYNDGVNSLTYSQLIDDQFIYRIIYPAISSQGTELRLFNFSYAKRLKAASIHIKNVKAVLHLNHFLVSYWDGEHNAYLVKLNKNDLEEPQEPSNLGVRTVYGIFSHPNKGAYILSRKNLEPELYLMRGD